MGTKGRGHPFRISLLYIYMVDFRSEFFMRADQKEDFVNGVEKKFKNSARTKLFCQKSTIYIQNKEEQKRKSNRKEK